jgi:hypothetical protein
MHPMMLPFLIYQRWLETVFFPFLSVMQGQTNEMLGEAKSMKNEVIDKTKSPVRYQG